MKREDRKRRAPGDRLPLTPVQLAEQCDFRKPNPLNPRSGYRHTRGAAQPAEPARELTQALPPNAAITGGRANSRPGEVQTELPAGRVTLAEEQ
jgi:hypothetical protein